MRGGERLIREAAGICYFMELHPGVLKRNAQSAEALLQAVSDLRPTRWYLADRPEVELSLEEDIFEQIGGESIIDVIGVAR